MLTITAPIELKCKTFAHSMHEGFYHRITDQYSLMTSKLEPEDLLHIVTTPPEYYFGEGEEVNIFQQTNVNTHRENKLEVMNNLINRIMVSGSAELTYQDRVYITDILKKIGIHNVNEFMKQVRLVKEEQNQTNQLIDLYWNYAGELKQLVENYRNSQIIDHHEEAYEEQTNALHLHEEILNRLQTAAVYQTVQNFNSSTPQGSDITNIQLRLSEQYGFAQQVLLQKLKNEVRGEETPLIYRYENYYTKQQLAEEQVNEQNILTQVSSAVLLDLINNVYRSSNERQIEQTDNWYHMEQAFYQNAKNTMHRMENSMSNRYETSLIEKQDLSVLNYELQNEELRILNRLFNQRGSDVYQTINELIRQDMTSQKLVNRMITQTNEQQLVTVDASQQQMYEEHSMNEQTQSIDKRQFLAVEQELSRINRENINNQSKYIRMMEGIRESLERPKETRSREQLRKESLMALEHPEELLEQLRTEGSQQREQQQRKLSNVINQLPKQTREVYEIVREYLEAPAQVRRQMEGVTDDVGVLIRDVHQAKQESQRTMLVHKQQEQLHEQTKEVIEHWNERVAAKPQKKQIYEKKHTDLTMVHRSQEQQLNEEEIRQMIEQNRIQNRTVRTHTETVTDYETTQHQFNNINTELILEQTENVNELVRQGVQRELGALSQKLYHKLEKRLESEKRRRGY